MKIFFLLLFLLSSCVTREEVEATIWLNNFNESMKDLCDKNPELSQHGFYRKLNTGKIEFFSICNPSSVNFFAIHKDDFQRLLDKALPKKQEAAN